MSMKTAEFLISVTGVTLSVRPFLPFIADAVSLRKDMVVLFDKDQQISFDADDETISEIRKIGGLLLVEHPMNSSELWRETELLVS